MLGWARVKAGRSGLYSFLGVVGEMGIDWELGGEELGVVVSDEVRELLREGTESADAVLVLDRRRNGREKVGRR